MTPDPATATGIDHVELFVADWDDATAWYARVLGLAPATAFESWWADGDGPLMLAVGDSGAKLALFEAASATRGPSVSPHRVAFGTDAEGFLAFVDRLDGLGLTTIADEPVTAEDVVDHGRSYSLYFTDPDGNRLELTTNDHAPVAEALAA